MLGQLIAASVANLQQHINVMTNTGASGAVGSSMIEAHKTATTYFEKIAIALEGIDKFNRTMEKRCT